MKIFRMSHLQFFQMMYFRVLSGFMNHKNEVSGRLHTYYNQPNPCHILNNSKKLAQRHGKENQHLLLTYKHLVYSKCKIHQKHNKHFLKDNALPAAVFLNTSKIEGSYGATVINMSKNRSFRAKKRTNAKILLFQLKCQGAVNTANIYIAK